MRGVKMNYDEMSRDENGCVGLAWITHLMASDWARMDGLAYLYDRVQEAYF